MYFIKWWKQVFLSIAIVAAIFIIWDVIFTDLGVWGFNEQYLVGLDLINLPIEEWLFFICIPYACIFTHYAFQYFLPKVSLSPKVTNAITITFILVLLLVIISNTDKAYTFYNYSLVILILIYSLITQNRQLRIFYITFLIILVPFFIVNGILTGTYIEDPVVWYNNEENLGIRLGTIPIEDIGYAFSMLFLNIILIEKFKRKSVGSQKG
jgi:lycopene cyclase domain-containing protein